MNEEIWKDIPDYEGHYLVSNIGRVKSLKYGRTRLLCFSSDKDGYKQCRLSKNKKIKLFKVHYLVCLAFIGPRLKGMQIRHLDGSRDNNNLENLVYGTYEENSLDRKKHGTWPAGEKNGRSILTEKDVKSIKIMTTNVKYIPVKQIAKLYCVNRSTISHIKEGIIWKYV